MHPWSSFLKLVRPSTPQIDANCVPKNTFFALQNSSRQWPCWVKLVSSTQPRTSKTQLHSPHLSVFVPVESLEFGTLPFMFKATLASTRSFFPQTDQWFRTDRKHTAFPQGFADVDLGLKFWYLELLHFVFHIRRVNNVTRRIGFSCQWLNECFFPLTSNQTFAKWYHENGSWQIVVFFFVMIAL